MGGAADRWFTVGAETLVHRPGEDAAIGRLRPGARYRAVDVDDDWVWVPGPEGAVGVVPRAGVTFADDPTASAVSRGTGPAPPAAPGSDTRTASTLPARAVVAVGGLLVVGGALVAVGAYRPWAYWDEPGLWGDAKAVFVSGVAVAVIGLATALRRSGSLVPLAWFGVGIAVIVVATFTRSEGWYPLDFHDGYWLMLGGIAVSLLGLLLARFGPR